MKRLISILSLVKSKKLSPTTEVTDGAAGFQKASSPTADFTSQLDKLTNKMKSDLLACDAKWSLFVAAVFNFRYEELVKPFPPKYLSKDNGLNIDAVVSIIGDTPKLNVTLHMLLESMYHEIDVEVIELLYWLLVQENEPLLISADTNDFKTFVLKDLVEEKLLPTNVFQVRPSQPSIFEQNYREKPKKLAFYGNKLENFYSILQLGFKAVDGVINLCTNLSEVIEHTPKGAGWGASACGSLIKCIALCEYINLDEYVESVTDTKLQITSPELVRLRYLLFYGSSLPV